MSNVVTPSRPLPGARIYLDHNATTPLHPRVATAMAGAFELSGNPSSIHTEGRLARAAVERARRQVAAALGADPADLLFTSGGTEADCLGVIGLYRLARAGGAAPRLLTTGIEHPALLGAARALGDQDGAELELLPVDPSGRLSPDTVAAALTRAGGAALLAISLANHEVGTCQEVPALAALCHQYGALLFCDAVQAMGKIPVRTGELGADAVAISAHKIYGPKGAGALWVSPERDLAPLFAAGHQERGRRPGTENVIGAVGLGEAAELCAVEGEAAAPQLAALAAQLERGVLAIPGARLHGAGAPRVPGTVNVAFEGAPGEALVQALDLAGVAASTGAACTSGTVRPSAVLLALGLPAERAAEAVRFSLGRSTRNDEIAALVALLPELVERARRFA